MNDDNRQFLTQHADTLRMLRDVPDDGKFTDAQLAELTTHLRRAIKIAEKERCDCASLTKLVEAIESRDFAALGELIEPARLEICAMIDGTSPGAKKTNGAPIDLDFVGRAAAKSQTKRDEEAKRFEESQQFQRALDRYNIAWNAWSGTWEKIALSRNGNLIVEADEEDLTAALNGLVEVIRDRGFIDNLPVAVERFDPSYCDDIDDEEEAYAVKILSDVLNAVAGGKDAVKVAEALLAIEPLPRLSRAGSARRLLRIADRWPIHCEHCGRIQPPDSFDSNRCPDCCSTEGTLAALFNHIRRVDSDPSKQESRTDRLFAFWSDWRVQLQSAFPGADGDMALIHKWIEYLTTTKGMERHGWQFIKFADAASIIPLAMKEKATTMKEERPLHDDDELVGVIDLAEQTELCTEYLRQNNRQGVLYRTGDGRFVYHVWDFDDDSYGRTCQVLTIEDAYETVMNADRFAVDRDSLVVDLAKRKLDAKKIAGETKDGSEPDAPGVESVSAKPTTKNVKPKKVSDITADKLAPYLQIARQRLAWNEKGKPSGQKLEWWLEEIECDDSDTVWVKRKNSDKRRAYTYGYPVPKTKQWVKSLENEIDRRRKAGILIPGTEDWD